MTKAGDQLITEASAPTILAPADTKSGRLRVGIITPGLGSSGYYAEDVLRNATEAGVWAKGLQMFLDHPGETERHDRPERSVRDIAAVATSDAVWDEQFGGPVIEAEAVGPYRDLLSNRTFLDAIGVSIRASASVRPGTFEGRQTQMVESIRECQSVDFVTRAGRGGKVLALLESARTNNDEDTTGTQRVLTETTPHDQPPVTPAGSNPTVQEDTMPNIEEATVPRSQLDEALGRASTAETALTETQRQLDEAHAQLRTHRAAAVIDAVEGADTLTRLERRGLLADAKVTESGELDEAALTTAATEAIAEKRQASGAGQVRGMGGDLALAESGANPISWDDIPHIGQED